MILTHAHFCFHLTSSITPSAYLPQPHGKTAIVSGLNYISRIFALLGEILIRIRVDKRSPPQGQFLTARLEEVQALHSRIISALAQTPEPLRLKQARSQSHIPPEYGRAGFRQATFAEVKDFFDNPNASRANALNPFLVMQANLYVTQVRATVQILRTSDHLIYFPYLSLLSSLFTTLATRSICHRAVSRRADHVAARQYRRGASGRRQRSSCE